MIDGAPALPGGQNAVKDCVSSDKIIVARLCVNGETPSYSHIRTNYIDKNIPFILTQGACVDGGRRWPILETWLRAEYDENTGHLDVDYICDKYGDDEVPVARCSEEEYGAHPKTDMTFREYLHYLQGNRSKSACLYLKDYHFMRLHPDEELYKTPVYFSSDWLNEYCLDTGIDDYRFVYIGPKGSWTPFHADVLRSFSWSANVSGSKRWILYPPGREKFLKDKLSNLPFDVTEEPFTSPTHPSYKHRIEVVQNAGEVIFVPSGWHHQVHNLETTLSINHNWFNASNIALCWRYLQDTLRDVQKEISDCTEMHDWHGHCQVLLRAYLGFNYEDFYKILKHIAKKRLESSDTAAAGTDLLPLSAVMQQMAEDEHSRRVSGTGLHYWLAKIRKHFSDIADG